MSRFLTICLTHQCCPCPQKSHADSNFHAELRSLRKEHGCKSNLEAAELRDEQDRLAFISKAEDADMAAEKQPYAANSGSLGLAAPPLSQAAQDDDLHALDEAHEAWK